MNMGIAIPRPQMRSKERRTIEARLKAHAEAVAAGKSPEEAMKIAKAVDAPLWRVVYGETMPAWEQTFSTKRQADAFVKKHKSFGDMIFNVAKIGSPQDTVRGFLQSLAQSN
jgi:hypothetical protein